MPINKNKVIVIGAGIVGICCALRLQMAGYAVTLIDKEPAAMGCSRGNAGHFATEQIFPLAQFNLIKKIPKMLVDPLGPISIKASYIPKVLPWFVRFMLSARKKNYQKGCKALASLNKNAVEAYLPLLKAANCMSLLQKSGYIQAFEADSAKQDAVKESERLKAFAINHQVIDKDTLSQLEPNLKNCQAGLYFPQISFTTEPYLLAKSLFDCFITQGGRFKQQVVEAISKQVFFDSDGKPAEQIVLDNEKMSCDKIVICSGVYSAQLVKPLGYKIPLEAERGYHLTFEQRNLLTRPVSFSERKFIATPMLMGTRFAGTVEFAGKTAKANWTRANILKQHAKQVIANFDEQSISSRWMGLRPSLPDSLPVIGQDPYRPNIYYAFAHQHLGLTQAAITANLILEQMIGLSPEIDLSPFRVERFTI